MMSLSSRCVLAATILHMLLEFPQSFAFLATRNQQHFRPLAFSNARNGCTRVNPRLSQISMTSSGMEQNEFSRRVATDRLLKTSSGNYRNQQQRDYNMEIEANEEECNELARRFDLKDVYHLSANLALRRYNGFQEGYSHGQSAIQVEGTVHTKVTQTCVRTNEDFQVDLEFPIFAIVKPSSSTSSSEFDDAELEAMLQSQLQQQQQKGGQKKKKNKGPTKTNFKDDMMEIQRLLSQQDVIDQRQQKGGGGSNSMQFDFGDNNFDNEESIIEDESIYSANTGLLDVGELVAQTFWLQLDPYPKKPGTNPIQTSITG